MKKLILSLIVCLMATATLFAQQTDPVAVLFQVKGKVEYTKDGQNWMRVRRSKFLFSDYQVRSGPDGSGKVTIKESGENFDLVPNSLVNVTKDGLVADKGAVVAGEDSGRLVSGLMQRFSKSQSYTTVRRSHSQPDIKIDAVRSISLTDRYPDIVWENLGDEYSYQVSVGDENYHVPATKDDYVRLTVKPFTGEAVLKITAMKNGNPVVSLQPFRSRGQEAFHTVKWLCDSEKEEIDKTISELQASYGEDSFMLGSYFEKQDMWVASMDQYRRYLSEYPDEIEMTPYLFRVYQRLRLDNLYRQELEVWKAAMME
jgi:hypothetical protein